MRFLIANDDGILAPGIAKLAEIAGRFGEVYIVAPMGQCSAMSHSVTIRKPVRVEEVTDFPVPCERAFRIGGTPADCVKVGVEYLMEERPDFVLSGINHGYNAGMDIAYSGTIAVAMEGVMKEIPAIAFSKAYGDDYRLVDDKLAEILGRLLDRPAGPGKIWNVNFPMRGPEECSGILWNCTPAKAMLYRDVYGVTEEDETGKSVVLQDAIVHQFEENTDLYALENGYISVGTVTNMIMGN